jgi:uncharacterized protein
MNIDFPFHIAGGGSAVTDDDGHLRDMIEQLLFTSPGERVNRPDFGSGLMQLVFAPNSAELAATLQFTVQAALGQWLGDLVEVRELAVTCDDATLQLSLTYMRRDSGAVHTEVFTRETS